MEPALQISARNLDLAREVLEVFQLALESSQTLGLGIHELIVPVCLFSIQVQLSCDGLGNFVI